MNSLITVATELKNKNALNEEEILKSFKKNLKEGNLIVLEPGAKIKSKSNIKKVWDKLKNHKKSNQKEKP